MAGDIRVGKMFILCGLCLDLRSDAALLLCARQRSILLGQVPRTGVDASLIKQAERKSQQNGAIQPVTNVTRLGNTLVNLCVISYLQKDFRNILSGDFPKLRMNSYKKSF